MGGKNAKLKDTWKIVKMIDVAKFFIWNIIVGVMFIVFDGYLLIKFFVTLILLMLFTSIQAVKIIIGVSYLIKYKCITAKKNEADNITPPDNIDTSDPRASQPSPNPDEDPLKPVEPKFHIYNILDLYEREIRQEIEYSFRIAAEEKQMREAEEEEEREQEKGESSTPAVRQGEHDKF